MIAIKTQKVMWIHFLSVVFPAIAVVVSLTPYLRLIWRLAGKITSGYGTRRSRGHCLKSLIASFSNENADVPDVMNSNRRFDVLLDGTLLPHTTNLNAFILTLAVREFVESEHWKRENINFRLPFLTPGTSTFSLLKVPIILYIKCLSALISFSLGCQTLSSPEF